MRKSLQGKWKFVEFGSIALFVFVFVLVSAFLIIEAGKSTLAPKDRLVGKWISIDDGNTREFVFTKEHDALFVDALPTKEESPHEYLATFGDCLFSFRLRRAELIVRPIHADCASPENVAGFYKKAP